MKTNLPRLIAATLTACSFAALADGATFISAGPAIAANDPIRQSREAKVVDFVKLHPVIVNPGVVGANVLTVEIEGKVHTFVGGLVKQPKYPADAPKEYVGSMVWSGIENSPQGQSNLSIAKSSGGMSAGIWLAGGRQFELMGNYLVERNHDLSPHPLPISTSSDRASGVRP